MKMLLKDEFYSKTNHILDFYKELADSLLVQSSNPHTEILKPNDENAKYLIESLLTSHVASLSLSLSFFGKSYFHTPQKSPFVYLVGVSSNLLTMLRQILILSIDFCYLSKNNLHADYYSYNRPDGKWSDKNHKAMLDHGMSNLLKHSQFASPIKNQEEFTKTTKFVFKLINDYRYCNTLVEIYCQPVHINQDLLVVKEIRNIAFVLMYVGFCLLSIYEFSSVINTDIDELNEYWTTVSDYGEYATEIHNYYESLMVTP